VFSSPCDHHICSLFDVNLFFFFFKDPPPTDIYTLSLHDALPIFNEHILVVHLDKQDQTIKHLSVASDAYEAESIASSLNENVMIVRG